MTEGWSIEFYRDAKGQMPVLEWLDDLHDPKGTIRARIEATFQLLRDRQGRLPEPYAKHLEEKLWELRWHIGNHYLRVIYANVSGRIVLLLAGFRKDTPKTPRSEIDLATARLNDWSERKMRSKTSAPRKLARRPGEDDLDALMRQHRHEIPNFDELVAGELAALELGIKIWEARRARRLSQRQLAELAGVTQPMIARLEQPSNHSATVRTLAAVAAALGCRLEIGLRSLESRRPRARTGRLRAA